MLYDVQNSCYQLLKLLGCDLSAIDTITTWKQFGVLCIEFIFACIMHDRFHIDNIYKIGVRGKLS